jgi:hypothetical protein
MVCSRWLFRMATTSSMSSGSFELCSGVHTLGFLGSVSVSMPIDRAQKAVGLSPCAV